MSTTDDGPASSTLSPVAAPFTPKQVAKPAPTTTTTATSPSMPLSQPRLQLQKKRTTAAPTAWRAQAESLAQRPPQARASDPVRVTDEDGNPISLTPPTTAAADPIGPGQMPRSAPAGPAKSPSLPPGAGPEEDEVMITGEEGSVTKLWAEKGRLVLEIERASCPGGVVDPTVRVVHSVTLYPETNHLAFGCDGPRWNVVVRASEREVVYRRVNTVARQAGVTVIVASGHAMEDPSLEPGAFSLGPGFAPLMMQSGGMPPPFPRMPMPVPYGMYPPRPMLRGRGYYPTHQPRGDGQWQWQQQRQLVDQIQGLLTDLGEEDWPQGLRQMPLQRLRDYRHFLQQKKAGVTDARPPTTPVSTGAVVRYVGGGRYHGRREWWDGDVLDIGMMGVVIDEDPQQQHPYLVHFNALWPTRLMPADVEVLFPSVAAAEGALRIGADGKARTQVEFGVAADAGDWETAEPWRPPPPRPPQRLTGPDKHKLRRDDSDSPPVPARGRGRGGPLRRGRGGGGN